MKRNIIILVIVALISFFAGYNFNSKEINPQCFYGKIKSVNENTVNVLGLEVNDINFRSEFVFEIDNNTKITWRYEEITADKLKENMNISIYFIGEILESYPAKIKEITEIKVLDDEI